MERVLTTLGHEEPDRVPLFLLPIMHGAKELNMSIKDYFSRGENVFEGQMILLEKYQNDVLSNFFYAGVETEAWGCDVIYREDGPPNAGAGFIRTLVDIETMSIPQIGEHDCLNKVLKATELLKNAVGDSVPIVGVVISPFSLPVMQMGFSHYLDLIHDHKDHFWQLMAANQEFCVAWANAQLAMGATAICYFDPVSSPTIIPRELYIKTGYKIAAATLPRINGPTATHLASGACLPIADLLPQTGSAVIGVSAEEDLGQLKEAFKNKMTLLGNLNGVEMRHWSPEDVHRIIKSAIQKAAPGGGFIISDNHGEIPWQVSDSILHTISESVREYGHYPIKTS